MLYNDFSSKYKVFLDDLGNSLSLANFKIEPHWNIDHICYRSDTLARYHELKNIFSNFAQELIESEVNGRPITTLKLNKPIQYSDWSIDLLELPAPKAGKPTEEGFEHIEIVVDKSFDELITNFKNFPIKKNGLAKDFNQELAVSINGTNIKFHHISLESVVNLEANNRTFKTITNSGVLRELKKHNPLVVGTYPLGLFTKQSGINILLHNSNFQTLINEVSNYCKGFDNLYVSQDQKSNHIVFNFSIDKINFELYAENTPTHQQRAFKHFQIEERLLKLGSTKLKNKINNFRNLGSKIESAFAQALKIKGDPNLEILKLHSYSEKDLINRFNF